VNAAAVDARDLLAVGANPAIDLYYCLDHLDVGDVNRVASVRRVAGGKANNLARVYRRLGGNPVTTGIVAGETGRSILVGLREEGIAHDCVCADGESRQTVTLVEPGATTVLLEPGPPVTVSALDALVEKVAAWSVAVRAVALVGSLPPGAPTSYTASLVSAARGGSGALVAVDASGEALRLAAVAGPRLIKVNRDEFESAFHVSSRVRSDVERVYRQLAQNGVETLCLTDGSMGAFIISGNERFAVKTRVEQPVSTAGAGDAFLAGYLVAHLRGDTIQEAARLASAAAAAALQTIEAGFIDPAEVEAALERTELFDSAVFFPEAHP
jgi:1-phosphofructokinase family hexose kinase